MHQVGFFYKKSRVLKSSILSLDFHPVSSMRRAPNNNDQHILCPLFLISSSRILFTRALLHFLPLPLHSYVHWSLPLYHVYACPLISLSICVYLLPCPPLFSPFLSSPLSSPLLFPTASSHLTPFLSPHPPSLPSSHIPQQLSSNPHTSPTSTLLPSSLDVTCPRHRGSWSWSRRWQTWWPTWRHSQQSTATQSCRAASCTSPPRPPSLRERGGNTGSRCINSGSD